MRLRRALALGLAAGVLALTSFPAAAADQPMLIAHRGGAGLWPENTMGAFGNAHALFSEAGAPGWIELDTQFTSDEVLVVMHDATLDRTTDCTGPVVQKPAAVVTQCDADPDPLVFDPVPTLDQVLAEGRVAGWRLVVEIKDIPGEPGFDVDCTELADALGAAVNAAAFPKQNVIVQSFWPLCLDRLERREPTIATLLLTSSSTVNALAGVVTPVPLGFTLTANAVFATLRGYEYSAPDQDTIDLIGPVVTVAHLLGRKVVVWTVDDVARMQQLAAIGVDGIISDRPDLLVATFGP
ncbi:MAG: glycerophosphodiester phosphodiesterase [Actinomycetota bacterium]